MTLMRERSRFPARATIPVALARFACVSVYFLWVLWFPPTSQRCACISSELACQGEEGMVAFPSAAPEEACFWKLPWTSPHTEKPRELHCERKQGS